MKTINSSLLAIAIVSLVLVALAVFNSQATTAQQIPPGREVKVVNAPTEPVPINLSPEASIKVSNLPSLASLPLSVTYAKQKWEYMVIHHPTQNTPESASIAEAKLNELGVQGWDFVHREGSIITLKRPR